MLNIELARRQRGWTQKDLGDHPRVRIHRSFLSFVENGMGIPTADQLKRLSSVLGVPADRLLDTVPEVTASSFKPEFEEQQAG
jgi:transcriptional regulator with XRE-family HTH domain